MTIRIVPSHSTSLRVSQQPKYSSPGEQCGGRRYHCREIGILAFIHVKFNFKSSTIKKTLVCRLFVSIIFLSPSPSPSALCLFQITQMSRWVVRFNGSLLSFISREPSHHYWVESLWGLGCSGNRSGIKWYHIVEQGISLPWQQACDSVMPSIGG